VNLRVAFPLIGGKNWAGGYNYLLNLLQVLQREAPTQITPVLLAGIDVSDIELAPFLNIPGCEIVQKSIFDQRQRSHLLVSSLLFGLNQQVVSVIRDNNVDVVFEAAIFFGWRFPIPAIAWMPDFQHHDMPDLFSRLAWWKREIGFRAQIMSGRTIMVSSEDSKASCQRIYPSTANRIKVVRFAVYPSLDISNEMARSTAARYDLPERFFFMPNQFWVHKNHKLVLEALSLLRARGEIITVLATGKQIDTRDAKHVPSLQALLREYELEGQFLMPGMIPYEDLIPLMHASTALLNPSLYEGWSTTVEEARSAGIPMILSDIAVHYEQAGSQATYFSRQSPSALADCLSSFAPINHGIRLSLRKEAKVVAVNRVKCFANEFSSLVNSLMV
jgi:glycosyltransferase involved in cell wall biosynthesis